MLTTERLKEIKNDIAESRFHRYGDTEMHDLLSHITALQSQVTRLEGERDEARAKALEEAALICDGEPLEATACGGRYVRWPSWNPNGDVSVRDELASLAFNLAKAIRALTQGPGK